MKKCACMTAILFFFLSAANAEEAQKYTNETFARLSHIDGNVYIQRATELDYEEGMMNMPLTEGDRVGTTEGRAEIYLGRGKFLRLDYHTKIDFLNLPKREDDLTKVQVWTGSIYFSIMALKREKTVEIHTSDISLYILEDGLFRIDVTGEETEIFVFRGLVEAAGETGSVLIKDAQRLEAIDGYFDGHPSGFAALAEDSFDRWSEHRDHEVRKQIARRYLPDELEDFEYEMAAYGEWVFVQPFGYVWVPGGISPDWRPYWNGRWVWLSLCGWTWLPYEPWGWATFHFGRWHWSAGFGWYWIPTTMWGPGWVHWYWGYDYVGWAPVSYWGYPGVVVNNIYYGDHRGEYYPYRSRALTVVHKNQLRARSVSKVALSQEAVKDIGQIRLVKTQPSIRPVSSKVSVESLKDNRVRIQKSPDAVDLKTGKDIRTTGSKVSKTDVSGKVESDKSEKARITQGRNIPIKRTDDSSSSAVRSKKIEKAKESKSSLGSIYDFISRGKSKVTKKGSSRSSSQKGIKSSSKSESSSRATKSSSSSKSSSRSRSKTTKVKKKK